MKVLHSVRKFGKPSSGHRTGKCQFSFQSQRKAMPKNDQTTVQLHSSQKLAATAAKLLQSCPTLCNPTDGQSTRLPHPWDSPGKNTGVDCHFLLQRMKVKSKSEVAQTCLTLSDPMDCSLLSSSIHGIFQARGLK